MLHGNQAPSETPMPTVAETLAADQRQTTLSAYVTRHTKRALIDWFAAPLPGSVLVPATRSNLRIFSATRSIIPTVR